MFDFITFSEEKRDVWTIQDMEKLLHFLSKVFLLNFPLYAAHKQSLQTKMEELTQQEASVLSNYCDVHDLEIPIHLLQNVCLFCRYITFFILRKSSNGSADNLYLLICHSIYWALTLRLFLSKLGLLLIAELIQATCLG